MSVSVSRSKTCGTANDAPKINAVVSEGVGGNLEVGADSDEEVVDVAFGCSPNAPLSEAFLKFFGRFQQGPNSRRDVSWRTLE
jgi:hypothetical protein